MCYCHLMRTPHGIELHSCQDNDIFLHRRYSGFIHIHCRSIATPEVFKKAVGRVLKEADKGSYDKSLWDCLPAEVLQDQGLSPWHEVAAHSPSYKTTQ